MVKPVPTSVVLGAVFVLSYLLGSWRISWTWLLTLALIGITAAIIESKTHFAEKHGAWSTEPLEPAESISRKRDIMSEIDTDSCLWVNVILRKFFRTCTVGVNNDVHNAVKASVEPMFPLGPLKALEITSVDLGKVPPLVRYIRGYQSPDTLGSMPLDLALDFKSEIAIDAELETAYAWLPKIPIRAHKIDIHGVLRVEIAYAPISPYIGCLTFSFKGPPKLDLDISLFGFNIMDIPVLNTKILSFAYGAIESFFQYPIRYDYALLDFSTIPDQYLSGMLHVTILCAENLSTLTNAVPTSCKCILHHGHQEMETSTVDDESCPVWKEDFDFRVTDISNHLVIKVMDNDVMLGECDVKIAGLVPDIEIDHRLPVKGGVSDGWLMIKTRFLPNQVVDDNQREEMMNEAQNSGVSFARSVFDGVAGVMLDPIRGARAGGAKGFLKGVGTGLMGAVSKPTSGTIGLAKGTVMGTMQTPLVTGTFEGTKSLAKGVLGGIGGIFMDPFEGAKQDGVAGFGKGIATGLIGAVTKPVKGTFAFTGKTVHGLVKTPGKLIDNWKFHKLQSTWERGRTSSTSVDSVGSK